MIEKNKNFINPSDHLANERTFLSWIRTSMAIIGLGFVVVKFALFMMQISFVLGKQPLINPVKTYSGDLGALLVIIGLLSACFAYYQYNIREKALLTGKYVNTRHPALFLTVAIVSIGSLLFIYLIYGT